MNKFYLAILVIIFSSIVSVCNAQRENVWVFGNHAGVDFNTAPPTPFVSAINTYEGCASVCDTGGSLLFYTDGDTVWNRNHNIMPSNTSLIAGIPYGTVSTSQGALIVPMPDSAHKYYIFSLTGLIDGFNFGRLYYSVVNMNLNGGLGDIEPGSQSILIDTLNAELMTGVVGDHCNVWVLTTSYWDANTEQIKAFEITPSGLNTIPVISSFTLPDPVQPYYLGTMAVSPDRKKIAIGRFDAWFDFRGALELFSFDPATGLAANQQFLDTTAYSFGVCFSADNSKLYVSSDDFPAPMNISQFDVSLGTLSAIIGSKSVIGDASTYGGIRRAPDGKIYFRSSDNQSSLYAINNPNLAGAACGYTPNAISLAANSNIETGLPNVVPVFKRDTVYTTQSLKPPCFVTTLALHPANVTTGWDYIWNNGTVGPAATVGSPGTYWVSYHEPPCTHHVDTFHVRFESQLPLLQASAGCKNDSNARIVATPVDTITYTYTWRSGTQIIQGPTLSNHGDTLGSVISGATYTLAVVAPNGCDTILEVTTPLPAYQASFTVSDSIICMGGSVAFQNTSQGGFVQYQWNFADGNTSSMENPAHTYLHAGQYHAQLVARTPYPCSDTSYKTIIVDSILSGQFFNSPDSICVGDRIVFNPQTDSTALDLSWNWGDGTYTTTPNESVQHAYDSDGALPVQLTSRFRACPDIAVTDTVYVFAPPHVYLGPDSGLCLHGQPIYLENGGTQPPVGYRNLWSTGDTTSKLKVVSPGIYQLTVFTEPLGCNTTEVITINKDCYIDIPNAFTPNNDGVNDYFFPRQLLSQKVTAFNMKIFNRWGQIIFETDKTDGRGWDGKLNNTEQPQGVYVYLVDVQLDGRIEEHYQGNVTLIR